MLENGDLLPYTMTNDLRHAVSIRFVRVDELQRAVTWCGGLTDATIVLTRSLFNGSAYCGATYRTGRILYEDQVPNASVCLLMIPGRHHRTTWELITVQAAGRLIKRSFAEDPNARQCGTLQWIRLLKVMWLRTNALIHTVHGNALIVISGYSWAMLIVIYNRLYRYWQAMVYERHKAWLVVDFRHPLSDPTVRWRVRHCKWFDMSLHEPWMPDTSAKFKMLTKMCYRRVKNEDWVFIWRRPFILFNVQVLKHV